VFGVAGSGARRAVHSFPTRRSSDLDSAGANLAAVAAMDQRDAPHLVAQVLVYPMIDATCSLASHREFATGYGPGTEDMKRDERRSEEHTSELQSRSDLVCRLLLEKK